MRSLTQVGRAEVSLTWLHSGCHLVQTGLELEVDTKYSHDNKVSTSYPLKVHYQWGHVHTGPRQLHQARWITCPNKLLEQDEATVEEDQTSPRMFLHVNCVQWRGQTQSGLWLQQSGVTPGPGGWLCFPWTGSYQSHCRPLSSRKVPVRKQQQEVKRPSLCNAMEKWKFLASSCLTDKYPAHNSFRFPVVIIACYTLTSHHHQVNVCWWKTNRL